MQHKIVLWHVSGQLFFASKWSANVWEFSPTAGAHFPLAERFCRLYANFKGGKMRSSFSETPAASQSAFIIGQLYSTSVFVDINKLLTLLSQLVLALP